MNLDGALQTFFAEAEELLTSMESALLRVDEGAHDAETLNEIFRAAHTIKGSAGLFGLHSIVGFTHIVENLLDQVRSGVMAIDRDLLSLRAKEVVRAERETIQRLEFSNPKSPKAVVLRRTNEKWIADADPSLDLDQESVKNVVRDLVNLRIRDFDDESPKDLKKFGLGKPAASYSVEWSTASGVASETVLFGDKVKDKDRFYAKQGSRATVFEVDKYTFDNLNKSIDDLKEKHPLRFNRFDLSELEVDTPSKSYALEKVDGVWTLTKPEKTKARAEVISDLLILLFPELHLPPCRPRARRLRFVAADGTATGLVQTKRRMNSMRCMASRRTRPGRCWPASWLTGKISPMSWNNRMRHSYPSFANQSY